MIWGLKNLLHRNPLFINELEKCNRCNSFFGVFPICIRRGSKAAPSPRFSILLYICYICYMLLYIVKSITYGVTDGVTDVTGGN